jgi:hypothetical protein
MRAENCRSQSACCAATTEYLGVIIMRRVHRGSSDLLFLENSVFQRLQQQEAAARALADRIGDDAIQTRDPEELVEEIYGEVAVSVPVLRDGPDEIETKSGEVKHERVDYGRPYVAIENYIEVFVPFDGDGTAFSIQPSSYSLGGLRGEVDQSELRFKISLTTTAADQVNGAIKAFLDETKKQLDMLRADFAVNKPRLLGVIRQLIEARRCRLLESKQVASGLGYKVRQ